METGYSVKEFMFLLIWEIGLLPVKFEFELLELLLLFEGEIAEPADRFDSISQLFKKSM